MEGGQPVAGSRARRVISRTCVIGGHCIPTTLHWCADIPLPATALSPSLAGSAKSRTGTPPNYSCHPTPTLRDMPTQGAGTGGPRPGHTWKNPGAMGPVAIASLGAMLPITGLGAAAALCRGRGHHGPGQGTSRTGGLPLPRAGGHGTGSYR